MVDVIFLLYETSYIRRKYNAIVSILLEWIEYDDKIMIALTIKLQIGLNL